MKRKYEKPTCRVYELQHKYQILTASMNDLDSDEFFYGGGGNQPGR
jgi:hypothetical protein